jgi:putative transposase
MLVHQAFRFELDPNDATKSAFASHHGAKRVAFNWAQERIVSQLEASRVLTVLALRQGATKDEATRWARELTGPVPWSLYALRREWNTVKDEVAPWWRENSKEAYSAGLDSCARAFKGFFDSKGGVRTGAPVGFPKKKTRRGPQSCRFTTGALGVADDHHVRLPRLGLVRTKEPTKKLLELLGSGSARVLSATSCEEAGRFYVSFTCEVERHDPPATQPDAIVGVDWGVMHLATISTGEVVENPKALSRYQKKLRTLNRELSRRQRGSKRHRHTKRKLARCHQKVRHLRTDVVHKLTTKLASTYSTVVIEDLNVKGMTASPAPVQGDGTFLPNGRAAKAGLNRSVLDACPGELRRQLTYKLVWSKGTLVVADRFFASSKRCSSCGETKAKLSLDERTYCCEHCGLVVDRDLNAARNLAAYGHQYLVAVSGTETQNGRGGTHIRLRPDVSVKRLDGSGQPGESVTATGQPVAA